MPRIRTIKPEFWTSETVAELSLETRLTFIGIWNHCDDRGVWKLNPRLISSALYPLDDPSEAYARTVRALRELSESGRIVCFEAAGKRFFQVANWTEHQRIDKPTNSTLPLPDAEGSTLLTCPFPSLPEHDGSVPGAFLEDSRPEVVSSKGREGNGEESSPISVALVPVLTRPDVERICTHLADRIEENGSLRPVIGKTWRDAARLLLDKDKRTVDQVIAAIDWCQSDTFWRGNVMSMPTLRDKYDQLRHAATHAQTKNAGNNGGGVWDRAAERYVTDLSREAYQ